ncbi:MAG: MBL fold metallo-hydrolase [Pseudomonadales bacterium]
MQRTLIAVIAAVAVVGGLGYFIVMHTAAGQDFLLSRAVSIQAGGGEPPPDGLRVLVCGSAAPLPTQGREQGCLAVLTPDHYFIVDAGPGSANTIGLAGLPGERLNGVLLTHYHSDHIAAVPTINLTSWVAGRQGPLEVYGPPGVERIVNGFNEAYALDRQYRTAHHGAEFMPTEYGMLEAVEQPAESVRELGELTITSFAVDHSPIDPAVGYRFDYKGRSVVISGDTIVTDRLREVVDDADLLFSDALSLPIVQIMQEAAAARGQQRMAKVLFDIQDYHASVADVAELTRTSGVGMTALYHMVPGPRNALMEKIFEREIEDNMLLTRDGMWFTLPVGSDEVLVD